MSAVISAKVGVPASANITIVPLQNIRKVKPRTEAHIFLQDSKNFADTNFYLAFEGEVVGRAYGKAQDSGYMQLMAVDYSSYWDEAKIML